MSIFESGLRRTFHRPAGMTDWEWNAFNKALSKAPWNNPPDPMDFLGTDPAKRRAQQATMTLLNRLKTMQQEYEEAARKREEEMLSYADQLGQSRAAEINRAATQQQASAAQGLVSRGLGNSTIVDSVNRGIASDKQSQLTQQGESLAGMKLGIVGQRPIENPMFSVYAQLLGHTGNDAINKALLGRWF